MSLRWPPKRILLYAVVVLASAALASVALHIGCYFLAMHQDRSCFDGRRNTRAEVEACLYLFVARECIPSERIRGFAYDSGVCTSYRILGINPIHAIYDDRDRLIQRVSAYE